MKKHKCEEDNMHYQIMSFDHLILEYVLSLTTKLLFPLNVTISLCFSCRSK
jgi:hypothetical protein